jgi:hypothetical protein
VIFDQPIAAPAEGASDVVGETEHEREHKGQVGGAKERADAGWAYGASRQELLEPRSQRQRHRHADKQADRRAQPHRLEHRPRESAHDDEAAPDRQSDPQPA